MELTNQESLVGPTLVMSIVSAIWTTVWFLSRPGIDLLEVLI